MKGVVRAGLTVVVALLGLAVLSASGVGSAAGTQVVPRVDTPPVPRLADEYGAATGDAWVVPGWFVGASDIAAVAHMDGTGPERGAGVRSRSAFVFDVDSGEVLLAKNADNVRPVASLTKLVSALAMVSAHPDLDTSFCIGAEQYPSRSGARSRLSTGDCLTGWDAVGAALVASDNRAAYGMAAAAGLDIDDLIARMAVVSDDLGMASSTWTDPSGLEDENLSTARDIARATLAVAVHPVLAPVASAPFWDVYRSNKENPRRLFSTDRLNGREDLLIHAAKTGYTDTARYCFTTMMETTSGRRLVITLLGADGKLTRWADVNRILAWVEADSR